MAATLAESATAAERIDAIRAASKNWNDNQKHIAALASDPRTKPLADILARPEISGIVSDYRARSDEAGHWQIKHKRAASRAAYGGFFAAVVAGAMLYLGASPTSGAIGIGATLVYLLLIFGAIGSSAYIALVKPWNKWKSARNAAEKLRMEYFRSIFSASATSAGVPGTHPREALTLEFVRAFLMDDQREWFARRALDFEAEVRRSRGWRIIALILVVVASLPVLIGMASAPAVAPLLPEPIAATSRWMTSLGGGLDGKLVVLAGVVGAALQTLVTSLAGASLADRNAVVYKNMAETLTMFGGEELEAARRAAATGDTAGLNRFWLLTSGVLIAEQGGWADALQTAQLLTLDPLRALPKSSD